VTPTLSQPRSFIAVLIEDVIVARDLLRANDNAAARRNLVRSTLAAIEGLVWITRENVRESVEALGELTPLGSLALRERTYTVADNGDIIEQVRFVTLPAMIRLICRQAGRIIPDLKVRFDHVGWTRLKQAIEIRNRVTHPKSHHDLEVTDADLATLKAGFSWIKATAEYLLATIVVVQRSHLEGQREFLSLLESGDPAALQDYQRAIEEAPDH
jgi:hypothetical protein